MEKRGNRGKYVFAGNKKRNGFTLSLLLLVIIVTAALSAAAVSMFTKAVKRSSAKDALKVLSVVSMKQEIYFIDHGNYAGDFSILGLEGAEKAAIGRFHYEMDGAACMRAYIDASDYVIYKNFETQEEGCVGSGCDSLIDLIPAAGSAGCDLHAFGREGGGINAAGDYCAMNPDKCKEPQEAKCSAGKVQHPVTGECVCRTICSGLGAQDLKTCACSCPSSCAVSGQVMDSNCTCKCPADKPYLYGGKCNVYREGGAEVLK